MSIALDSTPNRRTLRFGALCCALAATGLILLLLAAPTSAPPTGWTDALLILAVLGIFVAAESSQIHVEVRQHTLSVSVSDLPLVLGLFLLDPWWLLIARLVSAVLVFVATRRSPIKSAFNLCMYTAEVGLGVALLRALQVGDGTTVSDWAAAYVVVHVLSALMSLAIVAAMSLLGTRPTHREIPSMIASVSLSAVMSTTLALMAIVVLETSLAGLVLLVVMAGAAALIHRAYYRLLRRHTDLGQLFAFTQTVGAAQTTDDVVATLLQRARDLLRAESAVLRLPPEPLDAALSIPAGEPLIVPRGTRDPLLRQWLASEDLRDALLVPLRDRDEVLGVLQVSNRLGQTSTFDRDDLSLLQTLAAHAEVIWNNGRLLEQLRHDAHHDGLTGLPNRAYFRMSLEALLNTVAAAEVATGSSEDTGPAVLLLDLDRFKEVNDTLGHPVGDHLLRLVAQRIVEHVPPETVVARLGGDEFAILVPLGPPGQSGLDVAAAIRSGLTVPFEVQGTYLEVGASIGVAVIPADGRDASTLLQHADVAMYAAKRLPTGVARYESDDDRSSLHLLAMAGELRRALETGSIVMHLQPQTRLPDGKMVCCEALARWEHPSQGTIMPDEFIPLAEQTGLIGKLTHVALVQALTMCHSWLPTSPDVGVAVNLSPRQLLDVELPATVSELLQTYDVPPQRLTLEITESTIMTDPEAAAVALSRLRNLGVRLSIDDFGTGYSALSYLQRLPLDELKIDKSFVMAMATDAGARAIVHAIIDLAHTLGLSVVAEGVEDEGTRQLLVGFGCDVMQGYLLSPPLSPPNVATWLERHLTQSQVAP